MIAGKENSKLLKQNWECGMYEAEYENGEYSER